MLPASSTKTRLPAFTVRPIEERFLVALTRLRGVTLTACICPKPLRTSKRFRFLCSTKLSSKSGTHESRDARGLRLNKSSNNVILEGSHESDRLHLIQHAETTCSSQRSGQALRSFADTSWSYPLNLLTVPGQHEWSAGPKLRLVFSQSSFGVPAIPRPPPDRGWLCRGRLIYRHKLPPTQQ